MISLSAFLGALMLLVHIESSEAFVCPTTLPLERQVAFQTNVGPYQLPRIKYNCIGSQTCFAKKPVSEEEQLGDQYESIVARYQTYTATEQQLIKSDSLWFVAVAALQAIPFFNLSREASLGYFMVLAVVTVYLGAKRTDLISPVAQGKPVITGRSAALAPIVSSISLFGLYLLQKYTDLHPETLYRLVVTLFGAINASTMFGALLRSVAPSLDETKVPIPQVLEGPVPQGAPDDYRAESSLSDVLGSALGCTLAALYLSPLPLSQTFICNNILAWTIAMQSLGLITLQSFSIACTFLMGLFFYDIWWVYGTDVMMTVATKVEAPVKFLYPYSPTAIAQAAELGTPRAYPFSVLGLGDVVIPGIFCAMMRKIDQQGFVPEKAEEGQVQEEEGLKLSYFNSAVVGYGFGLGLTFFVNQVTKAGQPALLFLVPSIISSALITASLNNEISQLLGYNFADPKKDVDSSVKDIST
mmetsp:Transcript_7582/g.9428  ORF Transcript_7582/g.9428 Transcript_7582/m.9428 type:complete len:471 (-) Transcript_7582:338-1750(-)|eukprot:CAMPEP_0117751080 /NCGR_PEP_ID=MMETSP0947-20121206/10757_1 /TAXON_ID=44440 /ORGANISM="Chattonella subsalsa, Strain CCMP2191" /LENGTH=470 /DNA_ID=CAMNT_0005569383 /DNA_START=112 /DNA_END=1524 /DNA_ORIENTATION=-